MATRYSSILRSEPLPFYPTFSQLQAFQLGSYLLDGCLDLTGWRFFEDPSGCSRLAGLLDFFQVVLPQPFQPGDVDSFRLSYQHIRRSFHSRGHNDNAIALRAGCTFLLYYSVLSGKDLNLDDVRRLYRELRLHEQLFTNLSQPGDRGVRTSFADHIDFIAQTMTEVPHIFLCHGKEDKARVRRAKQRIEGLGFDTWIDEDDILPGQDWDREIKNALHAAFVVVVFLSASSWNRRGYIQREIRLALDLLGEIPSDQIFIIPALLEPCELPEPLRRYQAVKLYIEGGFELLAASLSYQAEKYRSSHAE